jgi:hypothetical protein
VTFAIRNYFPYKRAVHQSCYGGEVLNDLPINEWFCQRCRFIKNEKRDTNSIRCYFCPEIKGIIKIVKPTESIRINSMIWAHISCVNWIKEIFFCDS